MYYCFTIMSYDGPVYYIIFRQWLRPSSFVNTYDNFLVTKFKYLMYNVQDYSVLYNNGAICDGWQFTHIIHGL
jgi:hypothetical protein